MRSAGVSYQYHRPDRPSRPPPPSPAARASSVTPPPPRPEGPVFVVILDCAGNGGIRGACRGFLERDLEELIRGCPTKPVKSGIALPGPVGRLFFLQWGAALDALGYFWGRCLAGGKNSDIPYPKVVSKFPCNRAEEDARLRELFARHAGGLLGSDLVRKAERRIDEACAGIQKVNDLLKGHNSVKVFHELQERRKAQVAERERMVEKLEEFRAAIRSIISWLEDPKGKGCADKLYGIKLFEFGDRLNWGRVHMVMMRECRRLEEGLPIYGCRRKIISNVNSNQVTILVGETGSGKSTQLVQFLADSGLAADGSIICTQPRKIAALSLARRVSEESRGCYVDNSVVSYPTYSSAQKFNSKIIFMTDHCLLQHCTNNISFSGVSYIIVDEAHERSLNTDLLLSLVKKNLLQRLDLRLIIMSATADAQKLSEFFYGCQTLYVTGRSFPVEIKYVPNVSAEASCALVTKQISGNAAAYVSDVVKMVEIIHKTGADGDILAFLTSQMEVEWACESFQSPFAAVLPLHGKLSSEDQCRIFQNYTGKRKVIFSTNLAETSLTIPGIKYVVDSGMVKESRYEPRSAMNVLKVSWVSQSSAKQRAGRAGRTEPGICYRLYSESDFQSLSLYQEPEIRKVHLGIAILRILALGIKNVKEFEFIDSPNSEAIDLAIQTLIQLQAVVQKDEVLELTSTGHRLVKLAIEPRLGKIVLDCFNYGLSKEGLVLAAVMANANSIFCRVGNEEDKLKADCRKVPFCHRDGDLFTLLSVYKEWEREEKGRNQWCWQNSINAKSLRRCQETVQELENCLRHELNMIIPSYWKWDPSNPSCNKLLKKVILSSLSENVALYTGCERIGYEVAQTGERIKLHPSCSLLIYDQKPNWVVFSEILSTSNQYLVCVTAVDHELLHEIQPPPSYDISEMVNRKLQMSTFSAYGTHLLRRLCGKGNHNLKHLVSRLQNLCKCSRADIVVDFDRGFVQVFTLSRDMEIASSLVKKALDYEKKWLRNECLEKCLFAVGPNVSSSVALFGAGAEIKHLELERRWLTVEVSLANAPAFDDKELLVMVDQRVSGIASVCKHFGHDNPVPEKWGTITFLNPEAAEKAVQKLNGMEVSGSPLIVCPVRSFEDAHKFVSYHAVRAKVFWPRKPSKGVAFVRCAPQDTLLIVEDCADLVIEGVHITCEPSTKFSDSVILYGIEKNVSEIEIDDAMRKATRRKIFDVRLRRGDPIDHMSCTAFEEALRREISPFLSNRDHPGQNCRVEVFKPEPNDSMMKAMITFDGKLHLEAAKALDHLQAKVLPGFLPWQKIECQHLFRSSLSCPPHVYNVIKKDLDSVLESFRHRRGVAYELDRNDNGSYRVKLSTNATKTMANIRRPLEQLMKGKIVTHSSLAPTVLEFLLSREGFVLMRSVEQDTSTCIMYDRQKTNLKVFGSAKSTALAEKKLVESLLSIYENKQLEIPLRGSNRPPDLMKEVVGRFGADLRGLKEKVPGADFILNTRYHKLSIRGARELKQKVEEIISEVAKSLDEGRLLEQLPESTCPICLCELEEPYNLEDCRHAFCRTCLVEQCESAIKSHEGFPLCCAKERCRTPIVLADLRSLLLSDKLEELFRASLNAFVASSGGTYRFCPSPDCPGIYKAALRGGPASVFACGACTVETCTKCHLEYHPFISCEMYKEFKEQPDSSLMAWRKGKEHVKSCPSCGYTIEKDEGCNHIACRCGSHICWVCLDSFNSSDDCYGHLRTVHQSFV